MSERETISMMMARKHAASAVWCCHSPEFIDTTISKHLLEAAVF